MKRRSVIGSLFLLSSLVVLALAAPGTARLLAQSGNSASSLEEGSQSEYGEYAREARIGLRISPVRLNYDPWDWEIVGRGSYLVNAMGGCNDCHTNPSYKVGNDPFMGQPEKINKRNYLAGGTMFGPFRSRNLTPDEHGRPAGLTFNKFLKVMRTGIDLKNVHPQISPLLQVMPWPVYGNMHERDLRAIYAFLKAIPHAEPAAQ